MNLPNESVSVRRRNELDSGESTQGVTWRGVTFVLLLIFSYLLARAGLAQDESRIIGGPSCATCTIEAEEITVVTSPHDVGLTPWDKLALADDGTVWLAPFALPYAVFRYQANGIQDLRIANQGQGPREFLRIERIETGPNDNLYVFGNFKLNRYTPAGEFIDTRRFPPQILDLGFLPDGSLIVNVTLHTRDRAGYVFHSFAADAEVMRSFGPETLGYDFAPIETRRRLAVTDAGAFWAARTNRYEIDLWDAAGVRRRKIVRQAEWFEPWEGRYRPPYDEPPLPRVWDISVDEEGLLWVLLVLPAEKFAPIPRLVEGANPPPQGSYSPAFDILVEVMDTASNTVVAQRRFPNTMLSGGFLRNLHVVFTDVDNGGEDQIFRIGRLTLVQ